MRIRSVVSIVNARAANATAAKNADGLIRAHLDNRGIVMRSVLFPPHSIDDFMRVRANWEAADAIVVSGGDGTVSAVANAMVAAWEAAGRAEEGLIKPLLLVGAGLQNAVASMLGMDTADAAVMALLSGRVRKLPTSLATLELPERTVPGGPANHAGEPRTYRRLVTSSVSAGTFADVVTAAHALDDASREFVALPMVRRKFHWATLWSTAVHRDAALRATVVTRPPGGGGGGSNSGPPSGALEEEVLARSRLLLASRLPMQYGRYSLTPGAHLHSGLTVLSASSDCNRARMFHLLRREAVAGRILEEDGVRLHTDVESLMIGEGCGTLGDEAASEQQEGEGEEGGAGSLAVRVDGELLQMPRRARLRVAPHDVTLSFIVP